MSDGLKLRSNGTVSVTLNKKQINLGIPTIGQLIELEELRDTLQASVEEVRDEMQSIMDDISSLEDDAPVPLEHQNRTRELQRALRREQLVASRDFFVAVIEKLSDQRIDDPDELPAWTSDGRLAAQVIVHWRTVPLAPGSD